MRILKYEEFNEALVRSSSLDQLRRVRKISKSTDIGDRVGNIYYNKMIDIGNALDKKVDTYEEDQENELVDNIHVDREIKKFKKKK